MNPWYDSAQLISLHLDSLDAIRGLIAERRCAAQVRKEQLGEFCVLGRFLLTAGGYANIIESSVEMPETVSSLNREQRRDINIGPPFTFPAQGTRCPLCARRWTLENCHDAHVELRHVRYPLRSYSGQSFGRVLRDFGTSELGIYLEHHLACEQEDLFDILRSFAQPERNANIGDEDVLDCLLSMFFCKSCLEIYRRDQDLEFYQDALENAGLRQCRVFHYTHHDNEAANVEGFSAQLPSGEQLKWYWLGQDLALDFSEFFDLEFPQTVTVSRASSSTVLVASFEQALSLIEEIFRAGV